MLHLKISIPPGPIKRGGIKNAVLTGVSFQFHLVRLKGCVQIKDYP